ncbi:DUF1802 family protein [Deinococcus humi]|uniref:DUF1802 family protein n=1 Tax=Deinococcus humi TaxID=662880 RepID=A0A7W8NF75_9DEIO|nr:DUF1802 family protein [Deinococcus humi]MBB5365099.1 hypothetical protein [Deinococcus humi]GGO39587.1 hypothetical protein GCM10008949_47970 [Deinococcus humi]
MVLSVSPTDSSVPQNVSALKEWDVQCQLLTTGRVSLLLRKGGIMETHDGFEVEHRQFLLYPTFLHQNPQELRGEYQALLHPDPAPGEIALPALAEVVAVQKVESLEGALRLEPLQALTAGAIERRFHYRNRLWLHALLLRVRPLITPLTLEETPDLLGCVSWVPLGDLRVEAGPPAVSEEELEQRQEELQHLLST